jgi:hypothetical protein
MASNNHLCAEKILSQYIDKCQEKILYLVYTSAGRYLEIILKPKWNYREYAPIDEFLKNSALWLYSFNFMVIIELQGLF